MNHTKRFLVSVVIGLCAALTLSSIPVYASANPQEPSGEAVVRGGEILAAALNASTAGVPRAGRNVAAGAPPASVAPPSAKPQDTAKKGKTKVMWISLISGFAVSGVLIHHYATS